MTMQMDSRQDDPLSNWKRPKIVVRKRTLNEIRDLAIRIICTDYKPLVFYYAVLGAPVLLIDYVLWFFLGWNGIHSARSADYFSVFSILDDVVSCSGLIFFVWLVITYETAFVGSLVTEYLGLWLFAGDSDIRVKSVFKAWWERKFQLFYYLVFTRPIRSGAFYPETILLERHPFFRKSGRISTWRRVRNIKSGGVGAEAFFAFWLAEFYVFSGFLTGWATLFYLTTMVVDDKFLAFFLSSTLFFPPFLMACRLFNVVYNFCYYVNYRISCEGWDVDLTFKTELARYRESSDSSSASSPTSRSRTLGALVLEPETPSLLDSSSEGVAPSISTSDGNDGNIGGEQ